MALRLDNTNIEVISRLDSSLDRSVEGFEEVYEKYLEDLDESKLPFLEGENPTRFVLRRVLDYSVSVKLKNNQIRLKRTKTGDADFESNLGAIAIEEIRHSLVDIKHPEGVDAGNLVMKVAPDKFATYDLIALLDQYGIVTDLYAAKQNQTKNGMPSNVKKNSQPSLNLATPAQQN